MPRSATPPPTPPPTHARSRARSRSSARNASGKIVGIGASAGGLEAFTELVRNLPVEAGLAYVLVQHLDPTHRSLLSELLARSASLPVREIEPEMPAEPDQIYVIPPNCDLSISAGILKLTPRERKAGPARSIDHFLKSLAADQGANAIGVILSGAGSDGAKGLKAVKEAGGLTFAQDAATSKYDSMPRSAIATGCVDFVLPPDKIALELARSVDHPGRTQQRAAANARHRRSALAQPGAARASKADPSASLHGIVPKDAELRKLFQLLRAQSGIDFGLYRINTIRRRLKRRLTLHKLHDLAQYLRFLRENPSEIDALYQDLLINVTSFFRNPALFETLKRQVFPKLFRNAAAQDTIRIWIPGCSTGQEAYSYAMVLAEYGEKASLPAAIQIFATDVNATVLELARAGRYTKAQVQGVSRDRLERFFEREPDGYRLTKAVRERVVFAQHNLLTDPPFTRVDLISCRNMLIYIEPALQQKIIPVFHYALRSNGYLVLGPSESVGVATKLFTPIGKTQKIYLKKNTVIGGQPARPVLVPASRPAPARAPRSGPVADAADVYREADRVTLSRYAPAGVLVTEEGEVLQFRGKVQPFLEIPTGKATLNVLKLTRRGLALPLQRGLLRARQENRPVREKALSFDGSRQLVNLEIIPLRTSHARCFLILFEKLAPPAKPVLPELVAGKDSRPDRTATRRYLDLKREYADALQHLETLREQHDTAVEELQASNEEVQSSNEELQSLNEELETSNEELESANEELTTLNEELSTRNVELRESEQRLREQQELVELAPLIARSPKDRIIFWSRGAEKLYGFSKDEALGQMSHLFLGAEYAEPLETIQRHVMQHGRWEGEAVHRHKDGTRLNIATQWVVNLDEEGKPRAVLEVNTDISARRRAEESLRQAQELNQRILECSPDGLLVLDLAGRLRFVNATGERQLLPAAAADLTGQHWTALWAEDSRPAADRAHRTALAGETARFQAITTPSEGAVRWWDVVIEPIRDAVGLPEQLLVVCRDVTERRLTEQAALEQAKLAALRADLAVEIARGGELAPILQQLTQTIVHHTETAHASVWLLDPEAPLLRLFAHAGPCGQLDGQPDPTPVGERRIGAIAASKRPHVTEDVTADPQICDPEWARRERLKAFAGYPLVFESRLLGVLAVLSRRRLDPRLLHELAFSSDAISLLIQRKRADDERARLLQQAMTARNEAVAASRAKDEFLATLSHELRTPLNPVLLLASDAADDPALPPAIRATFETIRNNVVLEAKLIDDLLDLTRIAHGKLALEMVAVDVNAAVLEAVRTIAASIDRDAITFETHLEAQPATVLADNVRLQQIFWNLLNNAAKFTPRGGTVTVRTSTTRLNRVRIEVTDTGIGLREVDLARIFEPFSQVERRQGGLGLGLAISRQLLETHNGTIRALSDGPGKGSTFEVELPLVSAKLPGQPRQAESPNRRIDGVRPARIDGHGANGAKKRRLLLVEDHASTRKTLRTLLTNRNFEVITASSMAEARLRMEDDDYDFVISDLGLPDGDGYQLLTELHTRRPGVVGIALSGYGTEEDRARSRAAGFRSHLTKPVSIAALDQVIADALDEQPAAARELGG